MKDWLGKLKAGDKVIEESGQYSKKVATVTRTTKTLILIGNKEIRYRREDGWLSGGDAWSRRHITEATEEKINLVNEINLRAKLIQEIAEANLGSLPTYKLKEAHSIIAAR